MKRFSRREMLKRIELWFDKKKYDYVASGVLNVACLADEYYEGMGRK